MKLEKNALIAAASLSLIPLAASAQLLRPADVDELAAIAAKSRALPVKFVLAPVQRGTRDAIALTQLAVAQHADKIDRKAAAKFGAGSQERRAVQAESSRILVALTALRAETGGLTPWQVDVRGEFRRRLDELAEAYSRLLDRAGWTPADEDAGEPSGD